MNACSEHTRPILFLWGFDENGNPYMDARIDINALNVPEAVQSAKMMEIRMRMAGGYKMSLFHVQKDMPIEFVEQYIDSAAVPDLRAEILKKLQDAQVKLSEILGKGTDLNSVNFIQALTQDCNCNEEY